MSARPERCADCGAPHESGLIFCRRPCGHGGPHNSDGRAPGETPELTVHWEAPSPTEAVWVQPAAWRPTESYPAGTLVARAVTRRSWWDRLWRRPGRTVLEQWISLGGGERQEIG